LWELVLYLSHQQPTSKELTVKYKLDKARDVDTDEPGSFILNLPKGWRFDEASSPNNRSHVRGYDSMRELRDDAKHSVIPCDCSGCK
jgi:hypothetical protein